MNPKKACRTRSPAGWGCRATRSSSWRILRKSLDARGHDDIHFTYSAAVELAEDDLERIAASPSPDCRDLCPRALRLARAGLAPAAPSAGDRRRRARPACSPAICWRGTAIGRLILERGRAVKDRVADVRRFDRARAARPREQLPLRRGGRRHLQRRQAHLARHGPRRHAASWRSSPSATASRRSSTNTGRTSGSNRLPLVVRTLRRKFEALGGEVRFSCRVEDLDIADGRLRGLSTSSGYIAAEVAILAIGHSARDTYGMLLRRGVPMEAKPFQLGVRIEQPQAPIDRRRYGTSAGHPALGAAEYSASVRAGGRDLFTFCMCAGGYVMPSVSEPGYFCTNGMSESRHDSPFANSGLVVTIEPDETGSTHPLAGVHYQQRFERLAYLAAGRSYEAPLQWARDFLAGRPSRGTIPTSYRRGGRTTDLGLFLPDPVVEALVTGLPLMDRRFGGRFLRDATLTGPESRGSSPVRIIRDPLTRESPAVAGLYPCGEGAGYAGGIISAAVDGLRTARAIVAAYANSFG